MGVQRHVAIAFSSGKRLVNHCIEGWVGSQSRSGRVWKIPPQPGFDPLTVQLRSDSLYGLRNPGQRLECVEV